MTARPRTVLSVVGARPNFLKLAPLAWQLAGRGDVRHLIVHTGQHYDAAMSSAFFSGLCIPLPDCNLDVGSGSHAAQTAAVMQRFEPVCVEAKPDVVVVYGDVNSTLAATLVAAKLGVPVAHVEAGLRSRDRSMPEEINRVLTDAVADELFAPSRDAVDNLTAEGVPAQRIRLVGNIMIDSLVRVLSDAREFDAPALHGVAERDYVLVTLHRPANVDDPATLRELLEALAAVSAERAVLFALHPRTRARIRAANLPISGCVRLLDPLPYVEMLSLVAAAGLVLTDSGGLQEETSYLGVPCLTVRPNTERPITLTAGTNRLVAARRDAILEAVRVAFAQSRAAPQPIELWDGRTAERIVKVLCPDPVPSRR